MSTTKENLRENEKYRALNNGSVRTSIGGVVLENTIKGFKTVNIFGRDLLERKAKIEEGGASASFIRSNNFKGRTLRVEFKIQVETNRELMREAEKLNAYLLTKEEKEVYFTDDKYIYFGQVTRIKAKENAYNAIYGEFEVFCSDFKKYGNKIEIPTKVDTEFIVNYDFINPVTPLKIELKVVRGSKTIELYNLTTNKYIKINGSNSVRDVIEIYPKEQKIIKNKRQNFLKYLDIRSNLEDFNISYGDRIKVVTLNATVKFTIREERI